MSHAKFPPQIYHNNSERTTLKETKHISVGRNLATKILTYSIRITLLFSSSYTIAWLQFHYMLFTKKTTMHCFYKQTIAQNIEYGEKLFVTTHYTKNSIQNK